MNVRPATPADAPAIAALHGVTLPGDVSDFTLLGPAIVERFYAQSIVRRTATTIVAEEDGQIAGFVTITADVAAMFPATLLRGVGDALRFLVQAHPVGLARAAVAKFSSGTAQVAAVPELVYLAVDARLRGRGIGAALIDAADAAFLAAGTTRYELNVHADNASAVNLYLGTGFTPARRYEKSGHAMMNLVRDLNTSPPRAR